MKGALALAGSSLLAAALAACGRPPARAGTLMSAFDGVMRSPLCSQNVPADWNQSWPVPTGAPSQYTVLLYGLDRSALDASGVPRIRVLEPRGHATFTLDGRVSACDSHPVDVRPLDGERYGDAAMDMDEDQFDDAARRLLTLTEAVGEAYARRAPVDKRRLSDFWAQFSLLAEPALLADYYRADPSFWEWLRRQNGESLPAPKPPQPAL